MSAQALEALLRLLGDVPDPAAVSDPEAWDLIRRHSGSYGVRGLAAYAARPLLPSGERAWCDQVLTFQWRKYEQSMLHLEAMLELLDKAGVRALVLKGPLLARRHYAPPFLRKPSGDVDLGIRAKDFDVACDALLAAGYELGQSRLEAKRCSHHLYLLHATLPRVELHLRLSHGASGIPIEEFFDRAVPEDMPHGGQAWVLSEADEIFHLVLHYAQHRFPMLFNLIEVRRIWRAMSPETRRGVVFQAQKHHFLAVFAMTDIAFRATWGEPFLPADEASPKTWLHRTLNERLYRDCVSWSQPGYKLTLATRLKGRWLDFQLTDSPRDALRFLGMFANVAWFRLRQGGWRTLRYAHFAAPAERG